VAKQRKSEGDDSNGQAFPIVGIGASAGGLEALEQFLKRVPARSGMAFVVVQHLDPTHKGMLAEILGRESALPVHEITDRVRVKPDHVYVIPPNKDLSIVHGVLHLLVPVAPRGLRLPIDFFFRSLAEELRERSIGVVLSGMGSDGTSGLRAIRVVAGAVFVQTPASAKFDAMPRSAIDAGLADRVALPQELPEKIAEYLRHTRRVTSPPPLVPGGEAEGAVEKIIGLLRLESGNDFSNYKSSTIHRRIERRQGLHQIDDIARYVRYLRENPKETELLFKELLIGVTSFFRDPAAWEQLKTKALPGLFAGRPRNAVFRAWVPACSTGEEAYSLAIILREAQSELGARTNAKLQIFATDLDKSAIDVARQGLYPPNIAADVSPERLARFFTEEGRSYRLKREIREAVTFATQNVLQDPPFTKLDLLSCRNLLIYLTPKAQETLIPLFHYSLRPDGVLFLGGAEAIGTGTALFQPLEGKARLYRRLDPTSRESAKDFAATFAHIQPKSAASPFQAPPVDAATSPNLQSLVEHLLLRRFAPAAVLTGSKGDVLYVSGDTGRYLEVPAGKVNWNVLAMARDGLRHAVTSAFHKAATSNQPATLVGLRTRGRGGAHRVDLTIEPIQEPPALHGTVLLTFRDGAAAGPKAVRAELPRPSGASRASTVSRLERDLREAGDELRTTREEMQASQEELKSSNEELQSTNEELQSTNEELTTSKEEMQSMNEELQTYNHELQAKVDELARTSNDMRNLLDSTEIAILFLDDVLNVRRFTPQATTLFKLIPGDVGRPLADLTSELDYPEIYDDAREVLRTLVFRERDAACRDGRRLRVRIMPYRTHDNRIDGVVITLTNLNRNERIAASEPKAGK
jgi:chemotaxis methyl-accepting protein methylase